MSIFDHRPAPVSQAVLAELATVSTATAAGYLAHHGVSRSFMQLRRLGAGHRAVGRARTLKYLPLREDLLPLVREHDVNPQRLAIESIEPGDFFVIDAGGDATAGSLGDILTARIFYRGAVGIVVDGAIRDSPVVQATGKPVWLKAAHGMYNTSRLLPAAFDVAVQCAGVTVCPGDIMLGDDEGVVCIPHAMAGELASAGAYQEALENYVRQQIEAGRALKGAYPPGEAMRAEFDAWRTREGK